MNNTKVLIAIQPQWVQMIVEELKNIEVRKTRPSLNSPFIMYIYCTKDSEHTLCWSDDYAIIRAQCVNDFSRNLNGRIVAKVEVTDIIEFVWDDVNCCYDISDDDLSRTCLTQDALLTYGRGKTLYGYVINNIRVYKETRAIESVYKYVPSCAYTQLAEKHAVTRAPQSWCYVSGIVD